jgi:glutamine amidotransferase
MATIHIIDYGMGNLRSIAKAVEKLSFTVQITRDPTELAQAQAIILPGVGAFGVAMKNLKNSGMVPVIKELLAKQTPFLGICLGLQLLFEKGLEKGEHEGLGILKGNVVPFKDINLRIPHMGWNSIRKWGVGGRSLEQRESGKKMFDGIPAQSLFYFVHSYFVQPQDPSIVSGWCEYGSNFAAAIQTKNIWATQFHPEKSGEVGLQLLKNFCEQTLSS